jgi:galactokinase
MIEKKIELLLFKRVRHIVTENERVLKAKDAAKKQNFVELGKLL